MKRLRQYLLGKPFKIQTDHKALVWLHNVKDLSSQLSRWRLRIEQYKYEIVYLKGKENEAADCLSRLFPIQSPDQSQISDSIITPEEKTETSPTLTHQELIRKWKHKHEENLKKAKERIEVGMGKTKRRLDESIVRSHPVYKSNDLVKMKNNTKKNKLEASW